MDSLTPDIVSEENRRFEADLNAFFMSDEVIPIKAIMATGNLAVFFGVAPSVITNWAHRYDDFPTPLARTWAPSLYDVRKVVHWWIHWKTSEGRKSGRIPENWRRYFG